MRGNTVWCTHRAGIVLAPTNVWKMSQFIYHWVEYQKLLASEVKNTSRLCILQSNFTKFKKQEQKENNCFQVPYLPCRIMLKDNYRHINISSIQQSETQYLESNKNYQACTLKKVYKCPINTWKDAWHFLSLEKCKSKSQWSDWERQIKYDFICRSKRTK